MQTRQQKTPVTVQVDPHTRVTMVRGLVVTESNSQEMWNMWDRCWSQVYDTLPHRTLNPLSLQ